MKRRTYFLASCLAGAAAALLRLPLWVPLLLSVGGFVLLVVVRAAKIVISEERELKRGLSEQARQMEDRHG